MMSRPILFGNSMPGTEYLLKAAAVRENIYKVEQEDNLQSNSTFEQEENINKLKSQPTEKNTRDRTGQGGRPKSTVPNYVIDIQNFLKKQKIDYLTPLKEKPKKWTKKAQLIYLNMRICQQDLSTRNFFINEITKILNKRIKFQTDKIKEGEKVQFHTINRNILKKIKKISLRLWNKTAMPRPNEIKSMLKELIQIQGENKGSLTEQIAKNNQGYQYILKQFSIYQGYKQQENVINSDELQSLMEEQDLIMYTNVNEIRMMDLTEIEFQIKKQGLFDWIDSDYPFKQDYLRILRSYKQQDQQSCWCVSSAKRLRKKYK